MVQSSDQMVTERDLIERMGAVTAGDDAELQEIMEEFGEIANQVAKQPSAGERPLRLRDIVHSGSADQPWPMVVSTLKNIGYSVVYRRKTGDPGIVPANFLRFAFAKKDDNGERVFTARDPGFRSAAGNLTCMLHKDSPVQQEFARLGLGTCRKATLKTFYDVEMHMRHRHRQEWQIIEQERQRGDAQVQRDFQLATIEMARQSMANRVSAPEPASTPVFTEAVASTTSVSGLPDMVAKAPSKPKARRSTKRKPARTRSIK